MNLNINAQQLDQELQTLASFSDVPSPAVTRIVFSDRDLEARVYLRDLATAANLQVREDAVGNIFYRWLGTDPNAPAIGTGSHIDAIPHSGRYDGTVGVLGGLEAIRALQRAGIQPRRSIELLLFTSEEPTRFGIGCLGSRLLCGSLEASSGDRLKDNESKTLNEVRHQAGFQGDLSTVKLDPGYYDAFVELHIEQGPRLEAANLPLGVVTAIAAPASLRMEIQGDGGHAGAVLMPERRDAFLAASELALAVEAAAKRTGVIDTVATTGVCRVFPGAVNSIPSRVQLELDIRDIDAARRDTVIAEIQSATQEIAARRRVTIQTETINADAPALCDPKVIGALHAACAASVLPYQDLVSRAYHDSLFMSRLCPTAMLFIPCHKGYSHRPEEYATPEAIAQGVRVLAQTLATLSNE